MVAKGRPAPRKLQVIRTTHVTPNMLRVTFGGEGITSFPPEQAGGYIKLFLPAPSEGRKPLVRTYTIRAQRSAEIDVDFALHGLDSNNSGPATSWAVNAKPGDELLIGGPGPAKPLPHDCRPLLVVGDMTSLPAISVNLESLPENATGLAIIEVTSEQDIQPLRHPAGVVLRWLVNPDSGRHMPLPDALAGLLDKASPSYTWVACEFSSMRAIRAMLSRGNTLSRDQLYISSYWKSGLDEDSHKEVKREDAQVAMS